MAIRVGGKEGRGGGGSPNEAELPTNGLGSGTDPNEGISMLDVTRMHAGLPQEPAHFAQVSPIYTTSTVACSARDARHPAIKMPYTADQIFLSLADVAQPYEIQSGPDLFLPGSMRGQDGGSMPALPHISISRMSKQCLAAQLLQQDQTQNVYTGRKDCTDLQPESVRFLTGENEKRESFPHYSLLVKQLKDACRAFSLKISGNKVRRGKSL